MNAESAILGAAFLGASVVDRLSADHGLTPEDFADTDHARAWGAMLALRLRNAPITQAALAAQLGGSERDMALAADLQSGAGEVSAVQEHARIVKAESRRRRWHTAGSLLYDACEQNDERLVARAEALLHAPTVTDDTWGARRLGEDAVDFLADKGAVGVPTGLPRLDALLGGGLRPGDTTAIGAWTSMGKSAWVDTIMQDAALEGYSCHAYVNEMSPRDRTLRTLARMGAAPYSRLSRREVSVDEAGRVLDYAQRLPFGITECAQWSADQLARHIRANRWDLWALDLIHNMAYERESELHKIIATIAAAARSTGSHGLIVCQFNEARAVSGLLPTPVARDIRGSGMIKNLCANVLLLHREQHADGDFVTTSLDGLVKVDKSRHGQLGTVLVTFEPDRMRFVPAGLRAVA